MMKIFYSYLMILSLSLPSILSADVNSKHALADIEQAAYVYTLSEAQMKFGSAHVSIMPLDKRLNMAACASKLNAFTKKATVDMGKQTIGVKCYGPVPWTVYVQAEIKVFKQTVVAAKPLGAGHVLEANDIKLTTVDISQFRRGFVKSKQDVLGQQLKYPLAMGAVISPSALKSMKVVARGQVITLLAKAGTMEVRMSGKALASAALGQRVKVKNLSSKRVVEGIVESPGVVKVTM
jgi:flagella basal body P-ring formation protein FlgA